MWKLGLFSSVGLQHILSKHDSAQLAAAATHSMVYFSLKGGGLLCILKTSASAFLHVKTEILINVCIFRTAGEGMSHLRRSPHSDILRR